MAQKITRLQPARAFGAWEERPRFLARGRNGARVLYRTAAIPDYSSEAADHLEQDEDERRSKEKRFLAEHTAGKVDGPGTDV